jgi:ATP-binding cassette subfamily C (CFTR/MRP) protein 1
MVELQSGMIIIDGYNIHDVGLDALRSSLSLVPQETTLFPGTLRDNMYAPSSFPPPLAWAHSLTDRSDPQRTRTDAELLAVLHRAHVLPAKDAAAEDKFALDAVVGDEGLNYSAGERQLLALCRALVKNSRIIVLVSRQSPPLCSWCMRWPGPQDEATSSVDVETDAKIQRTIQTGFASSTLLCIAHRLNTVGASRSCLPFCLALDSQSRLTACYDKILVMDAGKVAEFDSVLDLFDRPESIFHSLCVEAGLSRHDIVRIRSERAFANVSWRDMGLRHVFLGFYGICIS